MFKGIGNTDEAEAYGAAVQAGIVSSEGNQDFLRPDVTPTLVGSVQGVMIQAKRFQISAT